jgi:predicted DNA-binding protein YlxM (UPF0122 family)
MSMIRKEHQKVLKSAARDLAKKYQVVFVMREYGGLSYEEIADTIGIKSGTVMSRLSRARKYLESYLTRFNAQFEREVLRLGDLHYSLRMTMNFEDLFCLKTHRTIHNGYFIRWKGKRSGKSRNGKCRGTRKP